MIRLGVVDFDTSHVVAFSQRLNHKQVPEEQWVNGAQIVCGCPGTSAISDQAKIDGYTKQAAELGLEILAKPEDLIGKVDGVLIESVDGSVHLERAKPFIKAGVPLFIDKPFTCSVKEAKTLAKLAAKKGVPVFSSSSLRYALEVVDIKAKEAELGKVVGVDAYSPASLHPRNPGFFNYGIHGLETLYALMGPGCESVTCTSTEGGDVITGLWKDGRIGVVRGTRKGSHSYGFVAWCEKGVRQATINAGFIYRELLKQVVKFFETKTPPIDLSETIEIMAFIEAAMKSAAKGGRRTPLKA